MKNHDKATFWEKAGYGFGDMSSSMFWKIFSYYLPFFYSNVFGLSLAHAGTLLLITKLYDAVFDPIMGMIADRTRTRWGMYRPYLLWAALPFAIAGVLTFTTPDAGYGLKHAFAYVTYIIMMTVYSVINVPYGAMLGVVTPDSREKTVFSSYRMFFAYGGSFIALAIFEPLLKFFQSSGGVSTAASWQYTMAVVGLICALLFFLCFAMTKERVKPEASQSGGSSVLKDMKSLVRNVPWWILLGAGIGVLLFNSIRGGVAAYYFKDVIGASAIFTCGIFLAVGEVANMLGVALAVPLSDRIGKKSSYILALVVAGVLSLFIMFLPVSEPAGLWTLMGLQVLISVAAGVTLPLLWSMFADIADYSEYKNASASTGLIFSSSSMAQKFGGAFGSALILWVLAAFGYDTSENVVQAQSAITGLKAMMSWIPAAGAFLAAIVVAFYPLTTSKMKEISAVLAERRAGKSN